MHRREAGDVGAVLDRMISSTVQCGGVRVGQSSRYHVPMMNHLVQYLRGFNERYPGGFCLAVQQVRLAVRPTRVNPP